MSTHPPRHFKARRASNPRAQKGIIGIILLIVAAIVGIVIWVASGDSVDAGEGARLRNSTVYSALTQQSQGIGNGFTQLVASGVAPSAVLLTDIFSSTLAKPLTLPKEALSKTGGVADTPKAAAVLGMAANGWSLIPITDATSGVLYIGAAAGPVSSEVCSPTTRGAAVAADTITNLVLAGNSSSSTSITFVSGPVPGCVQTTDGSFSFVYPLSKV